MEMLDLLEIGCIFEHELNVTHILANSLAWVTNSILHLKQ